MDRGSGGATAWRLDRRASGYPDAVTARMPRSTRQAVATVLLVFALAFALAGVSKSRFLLSDGYMNLIGGRVVAEDGIPHTDNLTVEGQGREWINQQWLAHRAYYAAYEAGGYVAVAVLSTTLVASGFAILTWLLLARGATAFRAATWGSFAFVVAESGAIIRAQSFAYPLFALLLVVLFTGRRPGGGREPGPLLPGLLTIPMLVAWANLHGSVLLAVAIVSIVFGLRALAGLRRRHARAVALHSLVALLAPLTLLATPYGMQIVDYYRSVLGNHAISAFITEWQPASFGDLSSLPPIAFSVIVLLVIGWAIGRGVRPDPLALGLTLAIMLLTMQSLRHQAWLGMVGSLLAADLLQRGAAPAATAGGARAAAPAPPADSISSNRSEPVSPTPARDRSLPIIAASVALVVGSIVVLATTPDRTYLSRAPQQAVDAAARYMETNPRATVLADEATSPALLWRYPQLAGRVAFDARLEIFDEEDVARWFRFIAVSGPEWDEALEGHDVVVAYRGRDEAAGTGHPELARRLERLAAGREWRRLPAGEDGLVIVRTRRGEADAPGD